MTDNKKLEKVGALWLKDGRNGKFMSGEVNGRSVVIFKNSFKDADKHPDYIVYDGGRDAKPATKSKGKDNRSRAANDDTPPPDDIPF